MSSCCRVEPKQRGVALVLALLVVAIVTLLATTLSSRFLASFRQTEQLLGSQQAWSYLDFAEAVAVYALQQDLEEAEEGNRSDFLGENWAEPFIYEMQVGGRNVQILGRLYDLEGRFNLNTLVLPALENQRFSLYQQRFIRLLQCFEEPALSESEAIAVTEAVIDWIDANNQVSGMGGAEDLYYAGQELPGRTAGRLLSAPSELRWVKGMTPELFAALEFQVSVWPRESGVMNINTASPELLRSLNQEGDLRPLEEMEVVSSIEVRDEFGWEDFLVFENGSLAGRNINTEGLSLVSRYFMVNAEVRIDAAVFHMSSVIERSGGQVHVIARSRGGW